MQVAFDSKGTRCEDGACYRGQLGNTKNLFALGQV